MSNFDDPMRWLSQLKAVGMKARILLILPRASAELVQADQLKVHYSIHGSGRDIIVNADNGVRARCCGASANFARVWPARNLFDSLFGCVLRNQPAMNAANAYSASILVNKADSSRLSPESPADKMVDKQQDNGPYQ
jgi:hypothetical protein